MADQTSCGNASTKRRQRSSPLRNGSSSKLRRGSFIASNPVALPRPQVKINILVKMISAFPIARCPSFKFLTIGLRAGGSRSPPMNDIVEELWEGRQQDLATA